jgi:multiple sugar transport system ATP-binding protein
MRKGELQQVASPQELYDHPVNLFVGGFIGSPAMNLVEARVERSGDDLHAVAGSIRIALSADLLAARPGLRSFEGRELIMGIRPEDIEDAELAGDVPAERRLRGTVELREALGSEILVHLRVDAPPARTEDVRELAKDAGDERIPSELAGGSGDQAVVVARFGARSRVQQGETIEAAVDTRALHFFDPETGLGVYEATT